MLTLVLVVGDWLWTCWFDSWKTLNECLLRGFSEKTDHCQRVTESKAHAAGDVEVFPSKNEGYSVDLAVHW